MSDNPLNRIPSFDRVSLRAVLVQDGDDANAMLAAAGIVDAVSVPVVLGEQEPNIAFGDGLTPNVTAVLETTPSPDSGGDADFGDLLDAAGARDGLDGGGGWNGLDGSGNSVAPSGSSGWPAPGAQDGWASSDDETGWGDQPDGGASSGRVSGGQAGRGVSAGDAGWQGMAGETGSGASGASGGRASVGSGRGRAISVSPGSLAPVRRRG